MGDEGEGAQDGGAGRDGWLTLAEAAALLGRSLDTLRMQRRLHALWTCSHDACPWWGTHVRHRCANKCGRAFTKVKVLCLPLASPVSARRVSYNRCIARGEGARPKKDNGHVSQSNALHAEKRAGVWMTRPAWVEAYRHAHLGRKGWAARLDGRDD